MTPMDFSDWLENELDKLGWSSADLARRSGLNPSTLSMVHNHKRRAGVDTCRAIAKAMHLPEADVLRAAGLMAPERDADPVIGELLELAAKLPADDRQDLIDLARAKLERRERGKRAARKASP
jgi:transcriptional regulator with XRE-family HTH domain